MRYLILLLLGTVAFGQIQPVNTGTLANDHTGDKLRTAFTKLNANDVYLDTNKVNQAQLSAATNTTTLNAQGLALVSQIERTNGFAGIEVTNGYPWSFLYDAAGAATAATNNYPWGSLYDVAGAGTTAAQAATNGLRLPGANVDGAVPLATTAVTVSNVANATAIYSTDSDIMLHTESGDVRAIGGSFLGSFGGDGSGLAGLNADNLTSGTVAAARLPGNVLTNGQSTAVTLSNAFTVVGTNSVQKLLVNGASAATSDAVNITGSARVSSFVLANLAVLGNNQPNLLYWSSIGKGWLGQPQDNAWLFGNTDKLTVSTNFFAGGSITATNLISGAYGCLAMGTGTVTHTVAQAYFTNWAYAKTSPGGIGIETNTTLVVTNAGNYRVSFGNLQNGAVNDVMTTRLCTNGVVCGHIAIGATATATSAGDTGFKEIVLTLPALCRVGLNITNAQSATMTVQNVVLNVKGAN